MKFRLSFTGLNPVFALAMILMRGSSGQSYSVFVSLNPVFALAMILIAPRGFGSQRQF